MPKSGRSLGTVTSVSEHLDPRTKESGLQRLLRHTYAGSGQVPGMTHPSRSAEQEHAFKSLYEEVYRDLVKFVQRRTDQDRAEDVVADVFLVVWRRFQDAPRGLDDARAWVFGIARNILLNERRGELRRSALGVRLADTGSLPHAIAELEAVVNRIDLSTAWRLLSEVHQEALGLTAFEGLQAPEAAAVIGISPVAFRLRLSRARRALRRHLDPLPRAHTTPIGLPERTTTS